MASGFRELAGEAVRVGMVVGCRWDGGGGSGVSLHGGGEVSVVEALWP